MDSTRIMAVINRTRYGVINIPICITIIVILITLCSCATISDYFDFKWLSKKFTYHFTGEDTGIDSVLNINGFFYDPNRINSNENIMFFKNGLVVEGIVDSKRLDEKKNMDISQYLFEICNNTIEYKYSSFFIINWGSYVLCGDTIKIQMINNDSWDTYGKNGNVMWYKILDKKTVKKIYVDYFFFSDLPDSKRDEYTYYPDECSDIKPLTFKEACVPSTDKAFILRHKWFWEDESKWREFMQRVYPDEKVK